MPSVLFVDDEPKVLSGLRRMLRAQRADWDFAFSESGPDALKRLEEHPADVVVSDMRMPIMDGAEFLTRVRNLYPETVRIVLSGHSDQELTLRAVGPAHQYLSKPCGPDDLIASIRSTLQLNERVRSRQVRRAIAGVDTLPALPELYLELVEEMNNPSGTVDNAGRIIAKDLGMSAKILQLVNSSFFGLPVRVTDVPHAVSLLGLGVIRPLVLSTNVFGHYEGAELGGVSLGRLTDHSTRAAMRAREIAAELYTVGADVASDIFLGGLMHDVGRLVLAQARPGEYAQLCREAAEEPTRAPRYELELFGATHGEVGAHLLQLWGLPTCLVQAVAFHHCPSEAPTPECESLAVVHAAEVLTDAEAEWDLAYVGGEGVPVGPSGVEPAENAATN